ncbi:MAG: hypothetical protein QNJ13_13080 [Paracoccaceae bacterium]|nr:hypothetical protein [Paracoccaceae bacterium]
MIRSTERFLPLPVGRALALAGSLLAGVFVATATSGAAPLEGDALRHAVYDRAFVVFAGDVRGEATFAPDGAVVLNSVYGTFEGRWTVTESALCLVFGAGPKQGASCVELSPRGQSLLASNGTLLAGFGEAF